MPCNKFYAERQEYKWIRMHARAHTEKLQQPLALASKGKDIYDIGQSNGKGFVIFDRL